jgi:Zn-dependent M28 family amino/carboxypeptidase
VFYAICANSISVAGAEESSLVTAAQHTEQTTLAVRPPPSLLLARKPAPVTQRAQFSGNRAYAHVLAQVAIGPRPVGTEAGWEAGEQIIAELKKLEWQVHTQEFVFRGVKGRNVIATSGSGPVVILGAHYDTRPVADRDADPEKQHLPILGANDGASGVAVLLELARVLDVGATRRQVWLAFFDAEDRGGIENWPYSVGANLMVQQLNVDPEAVVIVDMVGDIEQGIFYERYSDRALSQEIWKVADVLGYGNTMIAEVRHRVGDDHIPFLSAGIPAIDIIDFDYAYWHTSEDTADKVSPKSLETVGRTLVSWLQSLGSQAPSAKHRARKLAAPDAERQMAQSRGR